MHLRFLHVVRGSEHGASCWDEVGGHSSGEAMLLEGGGCGGARFARDGSLEQQPSHQPVAMRLQPPARGGLRLRMPKALTTYQQRNQDGEAGGEIGCML